MPLPDPATLAIDRTVSPRDTMLWPGMEDEYFALGRRALELVQLAAHLCEHPAFSRILDLPCGHGRVLRWLRAAYPHAEFTACDLDRDSVDFCRSRFGVNGVYSQPDLRALPFGEQFDLVWCGSLLTHLPPAAWLDALTALLRWTRDRGVLVFSTQGRYYASLLARGQNNIAENIDKARLLKNFARDGPRLRTLLRASKR